VQSSVFAGSVLELWQKRRDGKLAVVGKRKGKKLERKESSLRNKAKERSNPALYLGCNKGTGSRKPIKNDVKRRGRNDTEISSK